MARCAAQVDARSVLRSTARKGLWLVLCGVGIAVVPAQAQTVGVSEPAKRYTLPELVKVVSPGIVHVASLGRQGRATSMGSGFIADPSGLIVTSYHLLRGAQGALIKTHDGEVYDRVEVVEYDVRRDLLVLKIRPFSSLHALQMARGEQLALGDDVAVVGNPQGLENSVSSGIISGHRQAEGYRLIQTTAPVSPGSSGSPLLNMQAEVIGLISSQVAADRSQNLNFAAPVAYIRPLLEAGGAPMSIADFTRRVAQAPATGLLSGSAQAMGMDSTWPVLHDHSWFEQTCAGELRIEADSVVFISASHPAENWRVHVKSIPEVGLNAAYGGGKHAFHIRLGDDRNYNFALLGNDGLPVAPSVLFRALAQAGVALRK
jgi:hypothetical protein